jgi:hypothetical protein
MEDVELGMVGRPGFDSYPAPHPRLSRRLLLPRCRRDTHYTADETTRSNAVLSCDIINSALPVRNHNQRKRSWKKTKINSKKEK